MSITPFLALACPLDSTPLHRDGTAWRCASGHSFDIARQGYVHLLPVQHKRTRTPGDSKAMVAARQSFLNGGVYQPIAEAVSRATLAGLASTAPASCLDAGCGEGYYLRQLAVAAGDTQSLALLGVDISRWAILAATRQDKRPAWVVASNARLPVQSGTLDRILCLFGFPVYKEFARALKPDGRLIQVDAGPDHLRELRETLYPTLKSARRDDAGAPEGFTPLTRETIRYAANLTTGEQIADLLAMTPHFYRADNEGLARAAALTALTLTVDVRLTQFRRDG